MSPYPTRFSTHTEPSSRLAKWFSDVIEVIGTLAYLMISTIVGIFTGVIMSLWLISATTFTTPTTQVGTAATIGTSTLLKVVFIGLSIIGGALGWGASIREESHPSSENQDGAKTPDYVWAWFLGALVMAVVTGVLAFISYGGGPTSFIVLGGMITLVSYSVSFWLSRMLEP